MEEDKQQKIARVSIWFWSIGDFCFVRSALRKFANRRVEEDHRDFSGPIVFVESVTGCALVCV